MMGGRPFGWLGGQRRRRELTFGGREKEEGGRVVYFFFIKNTWRRRGDEILSLESGCLENARGAEKGRFNKNKRMNCEGEEPEWV